MKKFMFVCVSLLVLGSCINPRKYEDLSTNYNKTSGNLRDCRDSTRYLLAENIRLATYGEVQEKIISRLKADSIEIYSLYKNKSRLYDDLNDTYERLLKNNSAENAQYKGSLKELEEHLKERERKLREQEDAMKLWPGSLKCWPMALRCMLRRSKAQTGKDQYREYSGSDLK